MAADEELHGGPAAELQRLGDRRPVAGGEVLARRLGPAAGVGQRLGQRRAEPAPFAPAGREQVERQPVERRRPVERQGLGRRGGGACEVVAGPVVVPRPPEVDAELLVVGPPAASSARASRRWQSPSSPGVRWATTVSRTRSW